MHLLVNLLAGMLAVAPFETTPATAAGAAPQDIYDATRIDADLDVVLHERGATYHQAHARLTSHAESTASQIAARLARAPAPGDETRLWALLAAVAPATHVAELRARLRPAPPPRLVPPRKPLPDPRDDPRWADRDRALSSGVIATGVLFGLAAIGTILAIAIPVAIAEPAPEDDICIDCLPGGLLLFLAVVPTAAIPLTVVAGVRTKHRKPLRAYEASLAGAGFRLRF